MRYLSSFALSRGREPKSIPPFYSSTRQISRLTNSLYKYTFFIPPFPWRIHSVYYCTLKLHARTISVSNVVLFLSDCRGGSVLLYLVRRLYFVEVSKAFLVNRYFIRENQRQLMRNCLRLKDNFNKNTIIFFHTLLFSLRIPFCPFISRKISKCVKNYARGSLSIVGKH